jgi:hypothetical protein
MISTEGKALIQAAGESTRREELSRGGADILVRTSPRFLEDTLQPMIPFQPGTTQARA